MSRARVLSGRVSAETEQGELEHTGVVECGTDAIRSLHFRHSNSSILSSTVDYARTSDLARASVPCSLFV